MFPQLPQGNPVSKEDGNRTRTELETCKCHKCHAGHIRLCSFMFVAYTGSVRECVCRRLKYARDVRFPPLPPNNPVSKEDGNRTHTELETCTGAQFAEPKPTSHTHALSITLIAFPIASQGVDQCQKKMATVLALSWKPALGPY